jgi:hypothetical protein
VSAKIEALVPDAKTALGIDRIDYPEFVALQEVVRRDGYVISSVEGFEIEGDCTRLRMDATFSFSDSRAFVERPEKVRSSIEFANKVLSAVPDREALRYKIWFASR